ncbi:MAG: hybrid sensor histidine kinase/response regulator [Pseudomonadales bacterium]
MLQSWLLILCSLAYISLLFCIAYFGDRRMQQGRPVPHRALIFSLSLGVYFTSWTYYGAVGTAATGGWQYLAIYLGPILTFVLGYHFLNKVLTVSKEHNITTIADFISSRYGKTQSLAAFVTVIAILGTLPYIALQLKAVALSYQVVASNTVTAQLAPLSSSLWNSTGLIVAMVMALFTILFGTRYVNASEHHEGIILAIAFESVVKLFALICICLFAVYGVYNGFGDLAQQAGSETEIKHLLVAPLLQKDLLQAGFLGQTLLAAAAIFCLPRQFHVTFVENTDTSHLKVARRWFPLYLIITCLVVVPIAVAGSLIFKGQAVNPDMFVLAIPMQSDNIFLTLLAFIGGLSAATSMVIVAVIALSTMVCNDIVVPLLFKVPRLQLKQRQDMTGLLLAIRRGAIVGILFLSYLYYRYISDIEALASIGLIAFVAAFQFAPAIVGGVYWRQGHRKGAVFGLIAGFSVWFYCLFLPSLVHTGWVTEGFIENGLWNINALRPYALFGLEGYDPITHGLIWSLLANVFCYAYFSLGASSRLTDRIQAANFTHSLSSGSPLEGLPWWSSAEVGELRVLAERFIGEENTRKAFADYAHKVESSLLASEKADAELVRFTERLLAGAIGASSARLVISSTLKKKDMPIEDIVSIVDEASQAVQFNRELLHTTIENIDQGISVADKDQRIVAWNTRYLEMFEYPSGLIYVGRPIADIIRYNAERGECGPGDVEEHVTKRLNYVKAGTPHRFQRYRQNGMVVEMHGRPMPGGGFVTSFSDITEHKKTQQELIEINENLEQRVRERTQELSQVNDELRAANIDKTRFLAAVNHDLMQPLNAARLFTAALKQTSDDPKGLTERVTNALQSAEEMLSTLVDISKLDSGALQANVETFAVNDVLDKLTEEFSVIAEQRNIELRARSCRLNVCSDAHLLRRILQNFLSNAMRYTTTGRVLIGCRRTHSDSAEPQLRIEVWDTGCGIAAENLQKIFDEFERLDQRRGNAHEQGTGLGLSIAKRISGILQHPISVRSTPGKGTVFTLEVPLSTAQEHPASAIEKNETGLAKLQTDNSLAGVLVLCVDNDQQVLDAMQTLLAGWSCEIIGARSQNEAVIGLARKQRLPDIMLVDYHLDQGATGIELMNTLQEYFGGHTPGVLITADFSEDVKNMALAANYHYLRKPVNPGALRSLIRNLLMQNGRRLTG